MLNVNIQIDNKPFEDALAKSITLSDGDDLSKEMTNLILQNIKSMANIGIDKLAEEEVKAAVEVATIQAKEDFEILIEATKPKGK